MRRNGRIRLKRWLWIQSLLVFAFLLLVSQDVHGATESTLTQPTLKRQGKETGRQLSAAGSSLGSYAQSIKPMLASSRESSTTYNNSPAQPAPSFDQYSTNSVSSYYEPNQLSYSPSAAAQAYYYYHYPNLRTKHYGSSYADGLNDYPIQNVVEDPAPDRGFFGNLFYDLFPGAPEADSKTDPISIAGLASLVVTSLSGLSWVAIAALIIVLAPVAIPLIISPLIFLGLLIYFIPVLKFEVPGDAARTTSNGSVLKHLDTTAQFYKRIAQSDECIEKFSCELARFAQGSFLEEWIAKNIEKSSSMLLHRVSKSVKAARDGHNCQIFTCDPKLQLRRVLKSRKL